MPCKYLIGRLDMPFKHGNKHSLLCLHRKWYLILKTTRILAFHKLQKNIKTSLVIQNINEIKEKLEI